MEETRPSKYDDTAAELEQVAERLADEAFDADETKLSSQFSQAKQKFAAVRAKSTTTDEKRLKLTQALEASLKAKRLAEQASVDDEFERKIIEQLIHPVQERFNVSNLLQQSNVSLSKAR